MPVALLLAPLLQVIVTLAEKGDMSPLQAYTGQTGGNLNYLQLLQQPPYNSLPLLLLLTPQVIVALAEKGDMSALQAYTGQTGGSLNYLQLLQQLMMNNPSGAVSLAKMIAKQSPQPVDTNTMADLFLQRNMVREGTAFLLDALAGDKAEEGPLQTKLLEINLVTNPQVLVVLMIQC